MFDKHTHTCMHSALLYYVTIEYRGEDRLAGSKHNKTDSMLLSVSEGCLGSNTK